MKRQQIKVLLVEDEVSYAETVRAVLAEAETSDFTVTHVATLKLGLGQLASEKFDVVLLDLTLPDESGLSTYARIRQESPATPVIVLTGLDDQTLALTAVREGAQDYLVKGQVDARMLVRVIQYAIERKTAAHALRESEEFFRLISENVSDLIAVLDSEGRRLYNSPSYKTLLGDPSLLCGTDSFSEIHPEDQERVREIFRRTVDTGVGHRIAYRLLLKNQSVRFIESQGNAIKDHAGQTRKVVVVSRDMTEHKETETVLRTALADLKESHEELKGAQIQLVQSEKLEAVSTFAAGVAHEVKNPLQTIILGVDYLSKHLGQGPTSAMVLNDMAAAVHRADAIIRGLIEFSANKKREIKDENLTDIVEQSLQSVDHELKTGRIALLKDLGANLPSVKLDFRTMKHVFINLFMYCIRAMEAGGTLRVRTFSFEVKQDYLVQGRVSKHLKIGDIVVVAEVEDTAPPRIDKIATVSANGKGAALGLTVLKKIIELYGGLIDFHTDHGHKYTISFKVNPGG